MPISIVTAMVILALTAGTAYAGCGAFNQAGYVRYGDDSEVDFDDFNMTITNLNTSTVWYKGDGISTWSGSGYYTMTTNCPETPPYTDDCIWDLGDVVEYKVWSLDDTYSNTTYITMTTDIFAGTGIQMDIYVEAAGEEAFSKYLVEGWNLVSLPLTPSPSNSTSTVLSSMSGKYDAVYSYNAATKQFEDVSSGTMDPGTGYFVHITTAGTWTYNGIANTSINVPLEQGLNMVGWHNCTKTIGDSTGDALYSIKDNYYYAARWNATSQSFETYNPVAPNPDTPGGFNGFFKMERGEGYFISAKEGCPALAESC
ncbi:MAG: hypothetical protein WA977_06285 [Halobacteriota archaeon]